MTAPADVAPELLDRLRPICLGLPEAYEEPAWVGVRWRIRRRTFAHVLAVGSDHEVAGWGAATTAEPACVLTLRAPVAEVHALVAGGPPFYRPGWGDDVLGMVLDDRTDWDEVGELLTESYCLLAPRRLAGQVARVAHRPT
ncbi:MmcQ/YjbR family DNA-binding protein [Micromonospora sp. KC723]|uniref:MmcQ/YjbR family DNA-binding protein n=1 Tax=Micromonospora sp. KC723 TaxID=2530381 RepID=UPI0010489254|nr:MmcQ/YjbR family DNA-binding protein [Micromonospora sp. KC723]TDB76691.1 MmcQ/YjbR family DNA-binding protein [Micromonospora sp. KC723]